MYKWLKCSRCWCIIERSTALEWMQERGSDEFCLEEAEEVSVFARALWVASDRNTTQTNVSKGEICYCISFRKFRDGSGFMSNQIWDSDNVIRIRLSLFQLCFSLQADLSPMQMRLFCVAWKNCLRCSSSQLILSGKGDFFLLVFMCLPLEMSLIGPAWVL